jgi:hypothetical protein
LLTQAVGFKYVRLYPPSNTPFLYRSNAPWESQRRWPSADTEADAPAGSAPQGTISLVDVENPDLARFPLFEQAQYMETVLVRRRLRARLRTPPPPPLPQQLSWCRRAATTAERLRTAAAPASAAALTRRAAQGPGDALYIPAGCWHFVKSLSVSASISFVF